jgi:hypothetical protein
MLENGLKEELMAHDNTYKVDLFPSSLVTDG